MKNFDDIKNHWQQTQPAKGLPSPSEIIFQVEKTRKQIIRKKLFSSIALGLTFVFIAFIGFKSDFKYLTTYIGLGIVLFVSILGILFNSKLMNLLAKKDDLTTDNKTYLKQLIDYKNKQRFIQTKGMTAYSILLAIGIGMCLFEFAMKSLAPGRVVVILLTFGWIIFRWFYNRRHATAKKEKTIDDQITLVENLKNNLQN